LKNYLLCKYPKNLAPSKNLARYGTGDIDPKLQVFTHLIIFAISSLRGKNIGILYLFISYAVVSCENVFFVSLTFFPETKENKREFESTSNKMNPLTSILP
jgi:hypothetical protein